jgi:pimeloyl-ACP methyl ester carboxylesterase
MAEADQRDLLPRIAVPALLIWASSTPARRSASRQFEETIPESELVVIPRAGHASQLERPEPLHEAVRKFCRAHPGPCPDSAR